MTDNHTFSGEPEKGGYSNDQRLPVDGHQVSELARKLADRRIAKGCDLARLLLSNKTNEEVYDAMCQLEVGNTDDVDEIVNEATTTSPRYFKEDTQIIGDN